MLSIDYLIVDVENVKLFPWQLETIWGVIYYFIYAASLSSNFL